jgi:hypothetical protein
MEYKRLTTDNPEGNYEHTLNITKVINKEVYLRDIGEGDINLVDYCKTIYKREYDIEIDASAEEFGEYMDDDSLLSLFYWMAVGHAELGLRLSAYEDSGLSPEQVQEFAKAKAENRLIILERFTVNQLSACMRMAEHLNHIKLTKNKAEEPLINWQLYNVLLKASGLTTSQEEAEKALETGGDTP